MIPRSLENGGIPVYPFWPSVPIWNGQLWGTTQLETDNQIANTNHHCLTIPASKFCQWQNYQLIYHFSPLKSSSWQFFAIKISILPIFPHDNSHIVQFSLWTSPWFSPLKTTCFPIRGWFAKIPWPKFEDATAQDIRTTVVGQKPVTPETHGPSFEVISVSGILSAFCPTVLARSWFSIWAWFKIGDFKMEWFTIQNLPFPGPWNPMHLNIFNIIDLYTIPSKAKTVCLPHRYFFAGLHAPIPYYYQQSIQHLTVFGGLSVEVALLRLLDFLRNFWAAKKVLMN